MSRGKTATFNILYRFHYLGASLRHELLLITDREVWGVKCLQTEDYFMRIAISIVLSAFARMKEQL